MAKQKNDLHEQAKKLFLKSGGKLAPKEIAAKLGVEAALVRKWKYREKWDEELSAPHRGAPRGNKNAAGHGAPKGNQNAVTHGAFCAPRVDGLSEDEKDFLEGLSDDFSVNALRQLKRLELKRADLEKRISELGEDRNSAELVDRGATMTLPGGGEMVSVYRSSPFSRRMILEAELNRVDGRIIKLLDSIKSFQSEQKHLEVERERLELSKQKIKGIFFFDSDGRVLQEEDDADEIIRE